MDALKVRYLCLKAAAPMALDPGTALRYASVFELFVVCGYLVAQEALDVLSGIPIPPTAGTPDTTAAPVAEDDPTVAEGVDVPLLMH